MKKEIKLLAHITLYKIDIIFYLLILSFCFFCFQHGDLWHSVQSSLSYLNGHVVDFYEVNKRLLSGNDYFPTLYVVLALWNFPIKILESLASAVPLFNGHLGINFWDIFWSKALLVICFFTTARVLSNVSRMLTSSGSSQSISPAMIFATSPIAIFAVFIMGQYDVIGLLLTMVGFYFYLQRKLIWFSIAFSIAISCKFFPLVIFIPLLLLSEKKIINIIKYAMIAGFVSAIEIAIYWHSEAFRVYTLFGQGVAGSRLKSLPKLYLNDLSHGSYLVIVYTVICLYAYVKDPINDAERQKISVFISITSFAVFFLTVLWHPQWLIYLTPFFALSAIYLHQTEKFYLIETLGACEFILLVVNYWANGVDASLMQAGLLSQLFAVPLSISKVLPLHHQNLLSAFFMVYLFSPLLILLFQSSGTLQKRNEATCLFYFRVRFIVGLGIFLIPALFCGLAPKYLSPRLINKIDHNYYRNINLTSIGSVAKKPVGEITKGDVIRQTFIATHNNLNTISIQMATYARMNHTHIDFLLYDAKGTEIYKKRVAVKELVDNAFFDLPLPPIANSQNKLFSLYLSSPDSRPGDAGTAWMSSSHDYPDGILIKNGEILSGDLMMRLYYLPSVTPHS